MNTLWTINFLPKNSIDLRNEILHGYCQYNKIVYNINAPTKTLM